MMEMEKFNSETCVNKLLQGCTYTAGKCPCRLKKPVPEKHYEDTEKYVRAHWRAVVLCKECKWSKHGTACPMRHTDISGRYHDETRPEGWCYIGERK